MTSPPFSFETDERVRERDSQAREFYRAILGPEETLWFVSDAASVYDIWSGDDATVIVRCERHYGVRIDSAALRNPFWMLLDHLELHRCRPERRVP